MGLSIWHELDHPTQPLTNDEVALIIDGAQFGKHTAAPVSDFPSTTGYTEAMQTELFTGSLSESPEPSSVYLIGHTIGLRAGLLELDVDRIGGAGFQVATRAEIDVLRSSKAQGTRLHGSYASASFSYREMLRAGIQEKQGTKRMVEHPAAATIGFAIGLRYAELSPAEGIQEREAA